MRTFSATGADDDIVVSSVRAYVSAMNKLIGFISKSEERARDKEAADATLAAQKNLQSVDDANGSVDAALTPVG